MSWPPMSITNLTSGQNSCAAAKVRERLDFAEVGVQRRLDERFAVARGERARDVLVLAELRINLFELRDDGRERGAALLPYTV
jgi:hypothetical protein